MIDIITRSVADNEEFDNLIDYNGVLIGCCDFYVSVRKELGYNLHKNNDFSQILEMAWNLVCSKENTVDFGDTGFMTSGGCYVGGISFDSMGIGIYGLEYIEKEQAQIDLLKEYSVTEQYFNEQLVN